MNIADYIKKDHEVLARTSVEFLDFVSRNPEALERSNFKAVDNYDDGAGKLQMWPTFVNQHTTRRLREAGVELMKLIRSLPRRFFNNDPQKIADYYNIPVETIYYGLAFTNEEHLKHLVGRGDYVFTADGLKCVEYNLVTGLGGWLISTWEKLYMETPIIAKFLDESGKTVTPCMKLMPALWNNLFNAGEKLLAPGIDEFNIAFVFEKPHMEGLKSRHHDPLNNKLFKQHLESRKISKGAQYLCHAGELVTREDGVYYNDIHVPVIVNYSSDALDIPLRSKKLFDDGRLLVFNGVISVVLVDKLNMVLLSENQDNDLFNPAEKELIKELIPWSRRVGDITTTYNGQKVKLLDFIRENREKLVLKPTSELGGTGVFVGPNVSPEAWKNALEQALAGTSPWMVQEYAPPLSLMYQNGDNGYGVHDSVWGLFVFGDEYVDGFLRVMPRTGHDGVVNCKQGATVSKIMEVVEEDQEESADDWNDEMQFDFS